MLGLPHCLDSFIAIHVCIQAGEEPLLFQAHSKYYALSYIQLDLDCAVVKDPGTVGAPKDQHRVQVMLLFVLLVHIHQVGRSQVKQRVASSGHRTEVVVDHRAP